MTAIYRCCCGEECPGTGCCDQWCECPEFIYITTARHRYTRELYSCGVPANTTDKCLQQIVTGTLVGQIVCEWQLINVKFQRHICTFTSGSGCEYRAVVGPQQTGTVETTADANWKACFDAREDDETGNCVCAWYDTTCLGSAVIPLSNLSVNQLFGRLSFGCCEGSPGSENEVGCTCQPCLQLNVSSAFGGSYTYTPCSTVCGDQTQTGQMGFAITFTACWQNQHYTRWLNTCPSELNDLDVECSFLGGGCGSCGQFPGSYGPCPCTTQGQFGYPVCNIQGLDSCAFLTGNIIATCDVTSSGFLTSPCVNIS